MSTEPLEGLEPALLWERFAELTRIPRPPKEEAAAREHVLAWAAARGFDASVDAAGNAVVRVPATPGREGARIVVLQSHLDMVCERDPASPYDPRAGRIHVVVDGDWVSAEGTTLGADNGIGVAAAMAVADDPGGEHGPLELLFTVSEEQGLEGAKALDPALVRGRLLVNLDGTSDGAVTVGCAGSVHTFVRLELALEPAPSQHRLLEVRLGGARGGHSGADIAAGRANALKALGSVLSAVQAVTPARLAAFEGGVSRNAIPRDASAVVAVPANAEPAARAAAVSALDALRRRHAGTDDRLALTVEQVEGERAAPEDATRRALDLVSAIPTGVLAMSPELPGVVETSTSLTVARTEGGVLELASMTRSSNTPALDEVVAMLQALARLAGADIEVRRSYPPWEPRLDAPLHTAAKRAYERLSGSEPAWTVVHGGLECAVLGEKLPRAEMISIGPEIAGPHAPGERVRVSSVQRFHRLLGALLDDLSG